MKVRGSIANKDVFLLHLLSSCPLCPVFRVLPWREVLAHAASDTQQSFPHPRPPQGVENVSSIQ
ncbi:hypothetical protein E2C01_052061 [Portunus trituberculatus]|uniref:Uncharacterized protein n=1 Tax=Portunus trituberculatus TaxID=210409 RepID=A0A5B7GKJ5_PORTR|nr:hypothetical protein [Portunus trituberculatus]